MAESLIASLHQMIDICPTPKVGAMMAQELVKVGGKDPQVQHVPKYEVVGLWCRGRLRKSCGGRWESVCRDKDLAVLSGAVDCGPMAGKGNILKVAGMGVLVCAPATCLGRVGVSKSPIDSAAQLCC